MTNTENEIAVGMVVYNSTDMDVMNVKLDCLKSHVQFLVLLNEEQNRKIVRALEKQSLQRLQIFLITSCLLAFILIHLKFYYDIETLLKYVRTLKCQNMQ